MTAPTASGPVGAADAAVTLSLAGYGGLAIQVTSTFSGTLTFEGSLDAVNYAALLVMPAGSTTAVTTATAAGLWFGNVTGLLTARARMSSYANGAAFVQLKAVTSSPGGTGGSGGGSGSNASVGTTGSAVPASATFTGFENPSGNLEGYKAETFDVNTGAGTDNKTVTVIGQATASGGLPVSASSPLQVSLANTGANGTAVKVDGTGGAFPVSGTVAATQSGTWNVTNVSGTVSLPTGAATAALQTQPGVDIGDVTVNNAAGASAVNIQDGGNTITVDYATTGSGTAAGALRVELPTNGTGVIATVGTVTTVSTVTAVTALTNALPAGNNNIGDVDVASLPALVAGSALIGYVGGKSTYAGKTTLTSTNWVNLANGSGWQSVGVDTSGARDVHIWLETQSTGTAYCDFYIAEKLSNGTGYVDGATGTEGTFTAANRLNARFLGSVRVNNAQAQGCFCLSDIYAGAMPKLFAIIGINNAGAAINNTGSNTVFEYELVN